MECGEMCNHTNCNVVSANGSVHQTLSEMDWERGIWNAAFSGDQERVQLLLSKARDPRAAADARDAAGYSALHYAARGGHGALCAALAARGAQLDARTAGHATPLHKAAAAGNVDTVLRLIALGACVDAQDADGETALHKAAAGGHRAVQDALLSACPALAARPDSRGRLPTDAPQAVAARRDGRGRLHD